MKRCVLLFLLPVLSTLAATRYALTYQSALRDEHGQAFDASHRVFDVEFRIYRTSDLAETLWGRTIQVRLDDEGLFNVLLEDEAGVPLTSSPAPLYASLSNVYAVASGGDLFLGIRPVDALEEVRPRQKVLAAPSAVWALDVEHAPGDFTVAGTASAARVSAGTAQAEQSVQAGRMTVSAGLESGGRLTASDGFTARGAATVTGNSKVVGDLQADAALQADRLGATRLTAGSLSAGTASLGNITVNGVSPLAPRGLIVMWYGSPSAVPSGWALCNGQNGTPDLLDRFPVGAGGAYAPGSSGGANAVALSSAQMPAHRHTYTFYHSGYKLAWYDASEVTTDTKGGTYSQTTQATGNGAAHENRPKYRALYYIMKVR